MLLSAHHLEEGERHGHAKNHDIAVVVAAVRRLRVLVVIVHLLLLVHLAAFLHGHDLDHGTVGVGVVDFSPCHICRRPAHALTHSKCKLCGKTEDAEQMGKFVQF